MVIGEVLGKYGANSPEYFKHYDKFEFADG